MLDRLLSNLPQAINKDAQRIDAIRITGTGTLIIFNNVMQLIGASSAQFNLRTTTLATLATSISGVSGFSATNLQAPNLSASTLIAGTYNLPATIPIFTSFLWQLLKPVATALLDVIDAENSALLEMIVNASDGSWLDSFGELFGVTREVGEPDQLYASRIFNLSVGSRANNFAIQKALLDLQYIATVTDGAGYTMNVTVQLPTSPPQGFIYTTTQITNVINQLKVEGISVVLTSQGSLTETALAADSYTSFKSTAPVLYGSGRKWGTGVWGK